MTPNEIQTLLEPANFQRIFRRISTGNDKQLSELVLFIVSMIATLGSLPGPHFPPMPAHMGSVKSPSPQMGSPGAPVLPNLL